MPKQKPTTLLTISLPRAMAQQVERIRKAEQRGRSELVREALRTYFALARNFPEEKATPAEMKAINRARREMARGEYVTLDQLERELASTPLKRGRKNHHTRSRART